MVVLSGTGIGGDERVGAKYVPVTLAGGDLAFDGNDGLWCCTISRFFSSRVVSAVQMNTSEHHLKVEQFIIHLLQLFYRQE